MEATQIAYRVPFRAERRRCGHLRIVNRSEEALSSVVFLLHGPGVMAARSGGLLAPGEHAELIVKGQQLERATAVVVRWTRPNGDDYLWRVSF